VSVLTKDGSSFPAIAAVRVCLTTPALEYNGVRKIVQSIGWKVDRIPDVTLADLGYTKLKEKSIFRTYFNEEEAERVRRLFTKRKGQAFSAIAMSMRGATKRADSMGHCIESIIFSNNKEHRVAEVLYRSTEVIKKHGADLWFLPRVFERVGFEPTQIKFYYANAYLSGVFFPTLFGWWEPVAFLRELHKADRRLFVGGCRFLRRSVRTEKQVFPYSPEQDQHEQLWRLHRDHVPAIREFLTKHMPKE